MPQLRSQRWGAIATLLLLCAPVATAQESGDSPLNQSRAAGISALEHLRADELDQAFAALGKAADLPQGTSAMQEAELSAAAGGLYRALTQLDADEKFELLYEWSMPTDSRKSVRLLTTIVPRVAPPKAFARALGERPRDESFRIASIGEVSGLFSTAWELVQAAEATGNLRRLNAKVLQLVEKDVPNASLMHTLVRVVNAQRRDDELRADLEQRAANLRADAAVSSEELVVAAACLTHEWLQPIGEDIFNEAVEQTYDGELTPLRAFFRYAHATATRKRYKDLGGGLITDADLKWWIPSSGIWLTHEEHVLHLAGDRDDYLLFKYPLMGDFAFTCEAQASGSKQAEGGIAYGGLGFEVSGARHTLTIRNATRGERPQVPCPFVPSTSRAIFNLLTIGSTDRGVTLSTNRHATWTDRSNEAVSPWIGLRSSCDRTAVFRNLQITGNPLIPREVKMSAGDSLRGWVLGLTRQDNSAEEGEWFAKDGIIVGQRKVGQEQVVPQSYLCYQRPLLHGESISYEFQYEPGKLEVHPTLGRIAFLLEPDGVRLHWLTDGDIEWSGLTEGNAVTEPLDRRGPKRLPLNANDWNRVKVGLDHDTLALSLNDVLVYSRKMEPGDRSFGIYHDRSRSEARVRNVVMRGDWPARLATEQLDNLTAVNNPERSQSERRVLSAIFDDQHVYGSVLDVSQRAAALQPEERYKLLTKWVLPNGDHETLRTAFDFTPTHPASPINNVPATGAVRSRLATGGDLVSPALDLVQVAEQFGQLEKLRWGIQTASATTNIQRRSQASLLALVDIARRDFVAANRDLDSLEQLLHDANHSAFTEDWPETLVMSRGVTHPEIREATRDLAMYILDELRAERAKGTSAWERYISAHAEQLKRLQQAAAEGNTPATTSVSLGLKNWAPVSYTTARSCGEGFPISRWEWSPGQITKHVGHHEDYQFFRMPLRGDFEVEGEFGGFGWRDTQLMVAGKWLAPLVDHESYVAGSFRAALPPVAVEPRLPETGEWIRWRTVVKDELATTFLNGRRIHQESAPAERDPWIAIRSPYFGFGGARDVRITGTPEIPSQVHISTPADLGGWAPYFDESVGGDDADWRHDREAEGGGIIGRRRTDLPDSGLESLLRYHRPMLEDGSIEYEFYYSENGTHVHPTLGRRAFMLDPKGVRLHWVTDGAYDRTRQDPFNSVDEPANRRGPANLPLAEDAWNRLRLELTGDTVRLSLNQHLVYECDLEPTNQRNFGLFHYADQTEARVRNIVWRGDWPRQLPPVAEQQLADHRIERLDERLPELTAVFEHDFVRDGFPLWRFHVYDEGWEENIEAKPDGLHVRRPCQGNYTRFVVSPRMRLHGDFDAIAQYKDLVIAPTADGKWGVSLRAGLEDKDTTLCSVFRGMVRRPGQLDQHIACGAFTQWKPDRKHRTWYPGLVSEECSYGKLRLARRGDQLYSFISERDSPNYRHIHTETVPTDSVRYDGIRMRAGAYSLVDEPGMASVVWQSVIVRAEDITNLPDPPPMEAEDSSEAQ